MKRYSIWLSVLSISSKNDVSSHMTVVFLTASRL